MEFKKMAIFFMTLTVRNFNMKVVYLRIKKNACNVILLYLDDVMHAVCENKGIVIQDQYFVEGMESINVGEKDIKLLSTFIFHCKYFAS